MLATSAYRLLRSTGMHVLHQRVRPPMGVVFMCHSVGQPSEDEFNPNGKWQISTEQLQLAISCAEKMGFEAVSMDTAAEKLQNETVSRIPFYAITFDDGYTDNLNAALPVCQSNHVPMTVYVTSRFIQRKHVAWWHMIERLIADNQTLDIELNGNPTHYDCNTPDKKQSAFDHLSRLLTLASANEQSLFINQVCERYGDNSREYAESLFMSEAQLKEYASKDYAFVGMHGATHCAFSSLSIPELEQELEESRDYLTSITGIHQQHLAYPYGSPSTVTARDFNLAKGLGLTTAVTTQHACLTSRVKNRLALPRIPLFPTDTESSILCKLSGLTTLLANIRDSVRT